MGAFGARVFPRLGNRPSRMAQTFGTRAHSERRGRADLVAACARGLAWFLLAVDRLPRSPKQPGEARHETDDHKHDGSAVTSAVADGRQLILAATYLTLIDAFALFAVHVAHASPHGQHRATGKGHRPTSGEPIPRPVDQRS